MQRLRLENMNADINIELALVLQRHRQVDPTITRAERHVCKDPSRFQAAGRGWMGEGDRGIPASDPPTTPTEVRIVECIGFPTLPGYHSIHRTTIPSNSRPHIIIK
jgi:hypothetical protein